MPDQALVDIANAILEKTADGDLPLQTVTALRTPTINLLHTLGVRFLAEGRLELAEDIFQALQDRPEASHRAAVGLAKIAGKRGVPKLAATRWRNCLERFPERIEPGWLLELARAERELGDDRGAEATLRACVERYPRFAAARAALANLLQSTKRLEAAANEWLSVLTDFSEESQLWWFVAAMAALRGCGRERDALPILEEMCQRFPLEPLSLEHQAGAAAAREDWPRALELWSQCLERADGAVRPQWLNGLALALFRVWRIDDAIAHWRRLLDQFPDFEGGYVALASAARELGWKHIELETLTELIERFTDRVQEGWLDHRVRCIFDFKGAQEGQTALEDAMSRFPNSPRLQIAGVDFAIRMRRPFRAIFSLIETAARRFSADREVSGHYVVVLLASGRIAEADAVAKTLCADQLDHHALIACWRVAADRDGDSAVEKLAVQAVGQSSWTFAQGLALGNFLMSLWSQWGMALALGLYNELAARHPGRIDVRIARAKALVALREDDLALAEIDSIPIAFLSEPVLTLKAWAHMHRGERDLARERWRAVLAASPPRGVQTAPAALSVITARQQRDTDGAVVVFAVVRDEMSNLPHFLDHHRRLGIREFVVVDNMSRDESAAYLAKQPDVTLYQTDDHFESAAAGMQWINMLIERHCKTGWSLFVDADERFIYPGWETIPLGELVKYLEDKGAEAVSAFMLDLFPRNLFDPAGSPTAQAEYVYYDDDYTWLGHVSPPYERPIGGVRARLFQAQEYLHKTPLIKAGRGVYLTNHETTPLAFADISGALLHFKLHGLAVRSAQAASDLSGEAFPIDVGAEVMRRHQRYAARLEALKRVDLRAADVSRELGDSWALVERGLMRSSPDFRSKAHEAQMISRASVIL